MIAKLKISQIFVKNAEIPIEETLHIQQEIDFYTVFLLYLFTMCSFKIQYYNFFYQHEIKYPNNFERNFVWPKKAKQISSTQLIIIQTTFIQICQNSEPFVKNEPNIQCPIENVFSNRLFVKYVKTKSQQRQSYQRE